jgi:hypothetical protein
MRGLIVARTVRRDDHRLLNLWILICDDIDDETRVFQPEV